MLSGAFAKREKEGWRGAKHIFTYNLEK